MGEVITQKPSTSLIDDLLQRYPTKDETIEVLCDKGDIFRFRQWDSPAEIADVRKEADMFVEKIATGKIPPAYSEIGKAVLDDSETLTRAVFLARFNTAFIRVGAKEDGPPLNLLQWCQVAGLMPKLFDTVFEGLNDRLTVLGFSRTANGVKDAKKKLKATQHGRSNSGSQEATGTSIPENSEENLGTNP